MDRYFAKRLLVAASITGALIAVAVLVSIVAGRDIGAILGLWPSGPALFLLIYIGIEFSGKIRGPVETYQEMLDDDLDR